MIPNSPIIVNMSQTGNLLLERGEFNRVEEDDMELHFSRMAQQKIEEALNERIGIEAERRQLNRKVIQKAEEVFKCKLRDAQDNNTTPNEVINFLTLLGLKCLGCGKGNITFPVLKYCGFDESVKCIKCQYN